MQDSPTAPDETGDCSRKGTKMNTEVILDTDAVWCCGGCGLVFVKSDGVVSQDSDTHFSFSCDACLVEQGIK